MSALTGGQERGAIEDAVRRSIDTRSEEIGAMAPGALSDAHAIQLVTLDVEALRTISDADQRFFGAAAMADSAHAQGKYAGALRQKFPKEAAAVDAAVLEAARREAAKEVRKTAASIGAAGELDDLLRLPANSVTPDRARAAVVADLEVFAKIDDAVLRRSIAIAMGQVAHSQAAYRDELAARSASVAKEVGDAFRVFVGPDVGPEEGTIRRVKTGAELSGVLIEAVPGQSADVADEGGTIQRATAAAPAAEAGAGADKLAKLQNGRFIRNEKGEYRRQGEERLAFADEGEQIRFVDKQMDAFQAGVELAKAKGWKAIEATGTPAFRAEAWFHANLAGVEFVGYEPTDKDLKRLSEAQRFNDPQIESKQAAQKFALDLGHNVRAVGDGNQRFAGPLIHETEHHVVQDLGRQSSVVHRKKDLDVGEVGDLVAGKTSVRVQYKGGKGAVEVPSRGNKGLEH